MNHSRLELPPKLRWPPKLQGFNYSSSFNLLFHLLTRNCLLVCCKRCQMAADFSVIDQMTIVEDQLSAGISSVVNGWVSFPSCVKVPLCYGLHVSCTQPVM